MLKAVLDTNVLVSGLISPNGTPARLISAWRERKFEYPTTGKGLQVKQPFHLIKRFKPPPGLLWRRFKLGEIQLCYIRFLLYQSPFAHLPWSPLPHHRGNGPQ